MKKLLLSTAILGAATVPALAQDTSMFREAPDAMELRASDFLGMRVYATEAAVEGEEMQGIQEGWEDIGEINDIVMDRDGSVQAVLVDIGGFLGIGERTVAVSMDALQFVSDSATAEEASDFFLVMNANREALESAPEYSGQQTEQMTAEQAATETEQAIEEGGENVAAAGAAAGAAVGSAVEGTENAGEEVVAEGAEAAEGVENAVEETGEEIADAGAEVADEAADAGEEVSEEVAQTDMTDTQEDQAEVADAQMDATEETAEETAQAGAEATDEAADQTEMAAEGTMTETEMATEQTADAATAEEGELTTADTQEEVVVSNVPAEGEVAEGEVENTELTSAETTERTPVAREGFVVAGMEDFTAERLQGAAVYDANDERVGEVGEIILSAEGQVQQLVIDVGGFLGIGEKPVSLELTSLDILRQDGGEEIRVYVSQTEEELEGMERYEGPAQ